jgi:hypothetical protein
MRHRSVALALVVCLAAASLPGRPASASTSIALPLEALVTDSAAAVVATPITQVALWEGGRIVTYTQSHVDAVVAGSALGDEVWVRTFGGEVGNLGQSVEGEPVFTVGRPCLVFLRHASVLAEGPAEELPGIYAVTGRAQGQFPVVSDAAGQIRVIKSSGVGALMVPKGAAMPLLAGDALHGLRLADAKDAVARTWSRGHAP